MEFFKQMVDYFNKEQVSAKDVILISLITTFLTWVLANFSKRSVGAFKKVIFASREFNRKHIKNSLTFNEIIEIETKIEKNQMLKRYEKKAYEKHREKMEIQRRRFLENSNMDEETIESLKMTTEKMLKKKLVHTPKGAYFIDSDDEEENK